MNATVVGFIAGLVAVGVGGLWIRALRAVRLPENRGGFVAAFVGGAALGITALAGGVGWLGGVPAVLAIVLGAFFLFTFAISRQELESDAISVGATLPDFSAVDENGETFEAASLAGHPVLIKFFRGHW